MDHLKTRKRDFGTKHCEKFDNQSSDQNYLI